jgi:hypothetical protein
MPNVDFLDGAGNTNIRGRSADYSQFLEQRRIATIVKGQQTKTPTGDPKKKPLIQEGLLTHGMENGAIAYYKLGRYMPRLFLAGYGKQ